MPRPQRPPCGLEFPPGSKNDRSSTEAGKKIYEASLASIDKSLSSEVAAEKNWRFKYSKYLVKHVQASLRSPADALKAANDGLDWMHNNFEFVRDGNTCSFAEAMKKYDGSFETGIIEGAGKKAEFHVPYKGKNLTGEDLIAQVNKWRDYGTIEPSAAEAITSVAKNKGWCDLSDQYFVLLGAGSAMGPYPLLMALGANVIAVDLDRPGIWKRLVEIARTSPGRLIFPLKKAQSKCESDEDLFNNAGSDLINQTPEICNWLTQLYPEKRFIVGSYVYLNGALFVKVSLACDGIMKGLCEARKEKITLAYLCTPTDCHVIPREAQKAAQDNFSKYSLFHTLSTPLRLMNGTMLRKNVQPLVENEDKSNSFAIVDGLVVPQGPNYATAKRMQHWRSIVAREAGHTVSTNIAPSTSTASVVQNRNFAWAYDGMPFFVPMEIFQQDTSNAVMSALLINDIRNKASVANPSISLQNPYELFAFNSFHGGVWRCAYTVGSIGEVSVLVHFVKVLYPAVAILFLILIAYYFFF